MGTGQVSLLRQHLLAQASSVEKFNESLYQDIVVSVGRVHMQQLVLTGKLRFEFSHGDSITELADFGQTLVISWSLLHPHREASLSMSIVHVVKQLIRAPQACSAVQGSNGSSPPSPSP